MADGEPVGPGVDVRVGKTVGSTTTSYVYDVNRGLPVLLEDGTRRYVWGLGLAYTVEAGNALVYHTDGLGSVRALTNSSKAVVQTYESDEFGVPITTSGGSSQPFGYTGEQRDPENGLVYLRARMYAPDLGRFVQRDSNTGLVLTPSSQNRHVYVQNGPTTYTDHSGLCRDPGGSGLRYCIDRFIPQAFIAGGDGENRGADDGSGNPDNTFRIRQLIWNNPDGSTGYSQEAGISRGLAQEVGGTLERCGATVAKSRAARTIHAGCIGTNGLFPTNFGPSIRTEVLIQETGSGTRVVAAGTNYPSLEVWQYSDTGPPRLVFYYDAIRTGTNPVTGLFLEVPLPNHAP